MKVTIAGKGGSGKSSVLALAARGLADRGYRVLVVDTDESNVGLFGLLQLREPRDLLEGLGGKKEVGKRIRDAREGREGSKLFDHTWRIDSIPPDMISSEGNVSLIQIGKIKKFGEGCACALGMLSLEFLKNLRLGENEMVLVDTEAGIEHMGRGVENGTDLILVVLDPSLESVRLLEKIKRMSIEADKPMAVVLNKIEPKVEPVMRMAVKGHEIAATIHYDERVLLSGLDGGGLPTDVSDSGELVTYLIRKDRSMPLAPSDAG